MYPKVILAGAAAQVGDGSNTLFDYGCGDDVRGLVENGITASGWDPYHAPDDPIASAGSSTRAL